MFESEWPRPPIKSSKVCLGIWGPLGHLNTILFYIINCQKGGLDYSLLHLWQLSGLFCQKFGYLNPKVITSTVVSNQAWKRSLVKGSALFWFNIGSDMHYDTRVLHLGCPVLHGNKWIANKWIKMLSQFEYYPCNDKKKYYDIFSNKLKLI